jgi:hypothetical protein
MLGGLHFSLGSGPVEPTTLLEKMPILQLLSLRLQERFTSCGERGGESTSLVLVVGKQQKILLLKNVGE